MRLDLRADPQAKADAVLAAGCSVVFVSSPSLSGTYALDDGLDLVLGPAARDVAGNLGLPRGRETLAYADLAGVIHEFTADQVCALYSALRDYAADVRDFGAGRTPTLPAQPVTIP
jgi:hypothetical protein